MSCEQRTAFHVDYPFVETNGFTTWPAMRQAYDDHVRLSRSRTGRIVLLGVGHVFTAIAIAGVFLPLVPTTAPALVAAACYARASTRFYNWLLNNRALGPVVVEWRQHRSISVRHKVVAIALLILTIGSSIVFFTKALPLRIALALIGVGVVTLLLWIPTRRLEQTGR